MTVAALYVQTGGVYFGLDDVEPWDITRDAGVKLPDLMWGSSGQRLVGGGERGTKLARQGEPGGDYAARRRQGVTECLPKSQRHLTPVAFRDVLLELARSVGR